MDLVIELCICPREVADQIAREVVEKRLAACVDMLPNAWGLYGWKDSPYVNDEVTLLINTCEDWSEELYETIIDLHPSQMPVIVTIAIDESYSRYIQWLQQQLLGVEAE